MRLIEPRYRPQLVKEIETINSALVRYLIFIIIKFIVRHDVFVFVVTVQPLSSRLVTPVQEDGHGDEGGEDKKPSDSST